MKQKCVVSTIIVLTILFACVVELRYPSISLNNSHPDNRDAEINLPSSISALKLAEKENDKNHKLKHNVTGQEMLSHIDYSKPGKCGHYKCFFRSREDPHIGYLVTETDIGSFNKIHLHVWEIAKDIETRYNARHFYMQRPIIIKANRSVANKLGAFLKFHPGIKRKDNFFQGLVYAVYTVQIAPPRAAVIGCTKRKIRPDLTDVLRVLDKTKLETATKTFEKEINNLIRTISSESYLVFDFQVFVDSQGKVYHFDLDRGAGRDPPSEARIQSCTCNLKKMAVLLTAHARNKRNATMVSSYQTIASKFFSSSISRQKKFYLMNNNDRFGDLKECQTNTRSNTSTIT